MAADTPTLLAQARRDRTGRKLSSGLMVLGLIALLLGGVLLYARTQTTDVVVDKQDQGINQLVGSLATVCPLDTTKLPPDAATDCVRAKEGKPPAVVEGLPGTNGRNGAQGVPGAQGTPGQPGTPGLAGTAGTDGKNGQNGLTPPCYFSASMCQGRDGTNGSNGTDGRDGSPAMTEVRTFPDGSEETCNRSGGPDTAPTYSCSQTRAATTTPAPGGEGN